MPRGSPEIGTTLGIGIPTFEHGAAYKEDVDMRGFTQSSGVATRSDDVLAFVGGTIIDGNGGTPIEHGVIVIEGKRIAAVGDQSTPIPTGARTLSAAGQFIIPGLMDALVYLVGDYEPANTFIRYEDQFEELAIEGAQLALRNGVTTVFAAWGPRDELLRARDAIHQERVPGARIYVAGNIIGYGGPYSDDFGLGGVRELNDVITNQFTDRINLRFTKNVGPELTFLSPEEVRQEIRRYVLSGVDFLSVPATSHHFGSGRYLVFSPRVLQSIVDEAHAAGLPVMSMKLDNSEALAILLDCGIDVLSGCETASGPRAFPDDMALNLANLQIPCPISCVSMKTVDFLTQDFGHVGKFLKAGNVNARALIRAGALTVMMTGGGVFGPETLNSSRWKRMATSDGDQPRILGEGHFHWLRNAQELGMQPMAGLMSATRNVAKAFKVNSQLGTLERGKLADLLVLDNSPLERAENYRSISLVVKEGRIIDREGLPTQRWLTLPPSTIFAGNPRWAQGTK